MSPKCISHSQSCSAAKAASLSQRTRLLHCQSMPPATNKEEAYGNTCAITGPLNTSKQCRPSHTAKELHVCFIINPPVGKFMF